VFDDLLRRETEIRSILAAVMPGYILDARNAANEVLWLTGQ